MRGGEGQLAASELQKSHSTFVAAFFLKGLKQCEDLVTFAFRRSPQAPDPQDGTFWERSHKESARGSSAARSSGRNTLNSRISGSEINPETISRLSVEKGDESRLAAPAFRARKVTRG